MNKDKEQEAISYKYASFTNQLADNGDLRGVKNLVEGGNDINQKFANYDKWTALIVSCRSGHMNVMKYLLEKGAMVNIKNENGFTALMMAIWCNHKEMAEILLMYESDPSIKDVYGRTAESIAVAMGWNFDLMKIYAYYKSPFYFDYLFCCAIKEPRKKKKIVNKSKKRKRNDEMEAEKPFMQKFMERVIHSDLIFVRRVLPYLFGPYDV